MSEYPLYKRFEELSGLTRNEAMDFLKMKCDEIVPPKTELDAEDILFIEKISKEARKWKKTMQS